MAPFINQSGSPHVDPLAVSDLFFGELQTVRGFRVLPVNRSLAAMAALNMPTLTGPRDALKLAEFLGADMVFVGAVTAYEPYDPPVVGLIVQLYALADPCAAEPGAAALAPPAGGESGRAPPVDPAGADPASPRATVSEVYHGGHRIVQKQIQQFAEIGEGKDHPLGWRLYVKSIQHYVRFCCHRAIRQVLSEEQGRAWLAAARADGASN